ncbi:hypothetical protein P5673_021735 [Acropora cervicornis]|uniref:Uncharacterized protein n=1 Tax=Acropora cervicornis TaxID=6130 RepID=A0AAD9Q7N7_ACRCE|nr:hypothetical protein P5673_021735 [Acropora cervicornis]
MAALITRLHDVVQGFIEKPRRGTINLDKDTRTTIGSEVLQLSRAVVKRHTLGGDSRFRTGLQAHEAVVQVDFSENYTCQQQDNLQTMHWNQE